MKNLLSIILLALACSVYGRERQSDRALRRDGGQRGRRPPPGETPPPPDTPPPSAELLFAEPTAGADIDESSFIFTAQISLTRDRRVEFLVSSPTNMGAEVWLPANRLERMGDISLWTLEYDFDQTGEWSYQVRCVTDAETVEFITEPVGFTVSDQVAPPNPPDEPNPPPTDGVTATLETIQQVKNAIIARINQQATLAAKFVRLGFHDCVGGCDGCVDLQNPDNNGLDVPIVALDQVLNQLPTSQTGLSRADVWALAALTGAEVSQPNNNNAVDFPMFWVGRTDCEELDVCRNAAGQEVLCNSVNGPHRDLPSADLNTTGIVHFFSTNFGFSPRETVALMGAHTLGTLSVENSGFPGNNGWVNQELVLNNEYYRQIVGGPGNDGVASMEDLLDAPNWFQREQQNNDPDIPDRFFWVRGGGGGGGGNRLRKLQRGGGGGGGNNNGPIMLNADIALVRDFSLSMEDDGDVSCSFQFDNNNACPFAAMTFNFMAEFRLNNQVWLVAFQEVLTKMLEHGYSTVGGCDAATAPCTLVPN